MEMSSRGSLSSAGTTLKMSGVSVAWSGAELLSRMADFQVAGGLQDLGSEFPMGSLCKARPVRPRSAVVSPGSSGIQAQAEAAAP